MIGEDMKTFFLSLKTRPEAYPAIVAYLNSGTESALRLLKQGRIREAKKTLSDCADAHALFKSLPYYLPAKPINAAGGLPAGDKD